MEGGQHNNMYEKENIKARVKFCGNCNPLYDSGKLLKDLNQKHPNISYIYSDDEDYDLYMIINGCQVSCVSMPDIKCSKVLVSGYSVNRKVIEEDMLVDYIYETITKIINHEVI
ncbi:MAG: hypothetical protein PHG58_12165 [Clostridia bacterium]|nr:hypothetical protein [Clostridia bacterium]